MAWNGGTSSAAGLGIYPLGEEETDCTASFVTGIVTDGAFVDEGDIACLAPLLPAPEGSTVEE